MALSSYVKQRSDHIGNGLTVNINPGRLIHPGLTVSKRALHRTLDHDEICRQVVLCPASVFAAVQVQIPAEFKLGSFSRR
jgi:hypothetical protein